MLIALDYSPLDDVTLSRICKRTVRDSSAVSRDEDPELKQRKVSCDCLLVLVTSLLRFSRMSRVEKERRKSVRLCNIQRRKCRGFEGGLEVQNNSQGLIFDLFDISI